MRRGLAILSVALLAAACGDGTLDGWALGGLGGDADTGPACQAATPLVDVLWVVDDSQSMCDEQLDSPAGFAGFVAALGDADVRVAVTTTNVLDEERRGRFRTDTAVTSGRACHVRRPFPAEPFVDPDGEFPTDRDLDCECAACAGWDAAWVARAREAGRPPFAGLETDVAGEAAFIACRSALGCADPLAENWRLDEDVTPVYNPNHSTNRVCRFRCAYDGEDPADGDARCAAAFPDLRTECAAVPGDTDASGCARLPDADGCPAVLPGVLPGVLGGDEQGGATVHGIDAFRCLAAPPAGPHATSTLEQGFRAAWEALRPDGPRAAQVCAHTDPALGDDGLTDEARRDRCGRRFLRPGAALVVVFLSDEDDCSLVDGKRIALDDHNVCALLGDAVNPPYTAPGRDTDARPLWSIETAAERLRAVAPDPERVYVVTIVGDVVAGSDLERTDLRGAYVASLASDAEMAQNTAACVGPRGPAAYAQRYALLAGAFGARGFAVNLCGDDAFGADLAAVGAAIAADLPRCAP